MELVNVIISNLIFEMLEILKEHILTPMVCLNIGIKKDTL